MRTIGLTIVMSLFLFFTSCKDESVRPGAVTGDWQSEEIYVNGKLQENMSISTWLLLKENNVFQRNYVVGTWSLDKEKLALTPNEDLSLRPWQYNIMHLSSASLTLEITLTEKEYMQDIEGIDADELITVTEKYSKK